jgi:hypothetical protein
MQSEPRPLRLRFSHYFVNDFRASGSQNGKFGRSAKMAGGQHTADKDHAWQLGKAGDEDGFYAWMGDKWGLPHSIKLQTLFYDAKNNTQTLAAYHSATENLLTFLNQQQPPGKNMGGSCRYPCPAKRPRQQRQRYAP